jgi:hypothetical protein
VCIAHFRVIYRVTCDLRDYDLTGVSLFRTVLFWPTSPTLRLPRQPSERDKHVLERAAASWEDVERYQGVVPGYLVDRNMGGSGSSL